MSGFKFFWLSALGLTCLVRIAAGAEGSELSRLTGCTLVPAPWADGDSFRIRTPGGEEHTIRLYGVDCIEVQVNDETDARRLRAQKRYFGIAGANTQQAAEKAREIGRRAAARVVEMLGQDSFTVDTAFADGRGDSRYSRIYAFVTTAGGQDMGAQLVREGLARAFGVWRQTPDGSSAAEYRDRLRDLELQAAKAGRGAWALTDWAQLPAERAAQRAEDAELAAVSGAKQIPAKPVDINNASRDELLQLPGVGEFMANRIIESRPYKKLDDLLEVPGIGPKTLERLRPYLALAKPPA